MKFEASFRPPARTARGRGGRGLPILLLLALAVLLAPGLLPAPAAAQTSQSQYWDSDDVTIAVQPDGSLNITERQGYVFERGTFHGSFRDIDPSRLTGISNVSVSEDGVGTYRPDNTPIDLANGQFGPARTYQVIDNNGQQRIIWFYGTLNAPARKTMVIKYTVRGALRFYPNVDQLRWDALMPNRTARINRATVTVQMPPAVNLSDAAAKASLEPASAGTVQVSGPQQAVFTSNGALAAGAGFLVRLEWPHGLIAGTPAPWQQAEDANVQQYWDNVSVTATINPDSTFDVSERQGFVFTAGYVRGSYRAISRDRLTGISNVSVSEDGGSTYRQDNTPVDIQHGQYGPPGTFQVLQTPTEIQIVWFYDPFLAPARKTMVINYRVSGGLRFYPGGDQFWWSPFMPNRDNNIQHAQLTVQVPSNVNLKDPAVRVAFYPDGVGSAQVTGPQQAVFTVNGSLSAFQNAEARIQWPHGLINGSPPPWQAAFDQEQAATEAQARAQQELVGRLTLFALALSALAGVGGTLFWIVLWYRRGRDPVAGPIADYLNSPPSDLPAGLVGVLIDERADVRDVIATILDLGRKGHLRIEEIRVPDSGPFGGEHSDFQYTWLNSQVQFPYETRVLDALFDSGQNPVRLSDLKNKFYSRLPGIYDAMYQALVGLKYFPRNPQSTRALYGLLAGAFLVGAVVSFCGFAVAGLDNLALLLLPFAFVVPAVLGFILMFFMARKTTLGAEQAARWKAFGRYLAELQRFGNLEEAARRFGDNLPYAVAFGYDQQYVSQFNNVQTPVVMPPYYVPWGWYPPVGVGGYPPGYAGSRGLMGGPVGSGPQGGTGPDFGPPGGGPDFSPGGINAMNAGLVGAISSLNTGITSMINDASSVFTSVPRSSGGWSGGGGGWSGGGGFGGGGGGGGGSFGGGGSSSSGGGGGGGGGGSF